MRRYVRVNLLVAAIALSTVTVARPGLALAGYQAAALMSGSQSVAPPPGYVDFCHRHRAECPSVASETSPHKRMLLVSSAASAVFAHAELGHPPVQLDKVKWQQLQDVNDRVNREFRQEDYRPDHDAETYWDLPTTSGNCHDLALEKRRQLRELGWDLRDLRIATAVTPSGEGHAVLTIDTNRGTLVLDNLTSRILTWKETPYVWVSREMPGQFSWLLIRN